MKYLIVGLGNIGAEYEATRHNIGFRIADALAARMGARFETKRYGAVATGRIKSAQLVLLKPSTYMNLSGEAVRYWMSTEKIPIERVLVLVDDLALPFGALRLKGKGSDAGHNGLKNIAQLLGSQSYPRLRFGIGNDFPQGAQIDYVLGLPRGGDGTTRTAGALLRHHRRLLPRGHRSDDEPLQLAATRPRA